MLVTHFEFDTGDVCGYHANNESGREHIIALTKSAMLGKAEFSVRAMAPDGSYRVIAAGWTRANGEYTYSCDEWLK